MCDKLFFNKKAHYIYIDKNKYFKEMQKIHQDNNSLIDEFKTSFKNIRFVLNGKVRLHYSKVMEYLIKNYEKHIKHILYIINKITFIKAINIIKAKVGKDYHIIFDKDADNLSINLTLHHLCKQIFINCNFKIFKLDKFSKIEFEKKVRVSIIVDIINSEPILFIIKNINQEIL